MTSSAAHANGLANWRRRVAEEKAAKMAELEEHRKRGVIVERDGREFLLVRIPDRYDEERAR